MIRRDLFPLTMACGVLATTAHPQAYLHGQLQTPDRSGTANLPNAAAAPLHDLNILRQGIPPVLTRAVFDPYAPPIPESCAGIVASVRELDIALGADFNERGTPQSPSLTRNSGSIALALVHGASSMLLPYSGLVRTVTGAQHHDQLIIEAITAGSVRRGYLKGLGEAHQCPAPATPTHRPDGSTPPAEDSDRPAYPIR